MKSMALVQWLNRTEIVLYLFLFKFHSCVCLCVFGSLTVDIEVDCSTQVSIQVIEICGCALVHTGICALDRFQNQETILTSDDFVLKVEGWRLVERDMNEDWVRVRNIILFL